MSANDNQGDDSGPSFRYRSKRRNASVGDNIKTFNRHLEEASLKSASHKIHRPQSGRIDNRKARFNSHKPNFHHSNSTSNTFKSVRFPKNTSDLRNLIERKNEENLNTKSDTDVRTRSMFRSNNAKLYPSRLNKNNNQRFSITNEKPNLGIGESSSDAKSLMASNPHCKLASMQDEVFQLIVKFIKQYIECYDKNREDLLPAYHSKVLFSLSLNVKSLPSTTHYKFGSYFKESRNQLYVTSSEKNFSMLRQGHLDTIAFLNKMPPTEHNLDSLKLDSSFFMPNLLTFSVTGVFREGKADEKVRPYRSFQRVFVCIPTSNQSMVIVNEQYTISNLSIDQQKLYNPDATKPTNESTPSMTITIKNDSLANNINEMKQSMIQKFSLDTNLVPEWSNNILEFSDWDYSKAINNFKEHQSGLPSEAYSNKL